MFNFLTKVRNKSESEKIIILVASTIIVMVFVIGVWFFLSNIFLKPQNSGTENSNSSMIIFKSVSEQITQSFDDFQKILNNIKEGLSFDI